MQAVKQSILCFTKRKYFVYTNYHILNFFLLTIRFCTLSKNIILFRLAATVNHKQTGKTKEFCCSNTKLTNCQTMHFPSYTVDSENLVLLKSISNFCSNLYFLRLTFKNFRFLFHKSSISVVFKLSHLHKYAVVTRTHVTTIQQRNQILVTLRTTQ